MAPSDVSTRRCSRTSSSARSPLRATIWPSERSSGKLHFASFVQRRHRPGDHRVHLPHLFPHGRLFRSAADDRHVDLQFFDDLAEELAAPQQGFDEGHAKIRAGQCQRYPGQARATTDVGHTRGRLQQFRDRDTVQEVAVPDPVHFTRTDQTALHARRRPGSRRSAERPPTRIRTRCWPRWAPPTPRHVSRETSSGSRAPTASRRIGTT